MTDGGVSVSSQERRVIGRQTYWRHHIQAWQVSGLSQRAYCHKNDLSEYRFSKWKSRLAKDTTSCRFIRVPSPTHLPVPIKRSVLHVYSPNGFRVEINEDFDSGLLKKILTVLAEVSHAL